MQRIRNELEARVQARLGGGALQLTEREQTRDNSGLLENSRVEKHETNKSADLSERSVSSPYTRLAGG